jgi:precorrin-8X/cobalt-precorrin-8 methylmutase
MVAAGLAGGRVVCKVGEPLTERLARTASLTRAAAAIRLAFGEVGVGAFWVVGGGADTLAEILARQVEPAFVIGLPAGLVGAAEAKDALRASGVPSVSNVSEKGGPAVAVAAFWALLAQAAATRGARTSWNISNQATSLAADDGARR